MKGIYRLKSGALIGKTQELIFYFGIVFEKDGLYSFELYLPEGYKAFEEGEENAFFNDEFRLYAPTDDNNEVSAYDLYVRQHIGVSNKLTLVCHGHVRYEKVSRGGLHRPEGYKPDNTEVIYYLELEGLRIKFRDTTETIIKRGGIQVNGIGYNPSFGDHERDHTSAMFVYNSDHLPRNFFALTFFKEKPDSENIVVSFIDKSDRSFIPMAYNTFLSIKLEFIRFLSLLNGAEVGVRKEFIGGFHIIGKVSSQVEITYSRKPIRNKSYSSYVPINMLGYKTERILSISLMKCFDAYVNVNKLLDLNTIIFYLNGAQQASSLQEQFFIEIIAFERLAQKFIESSETSDAFIVDDATYQPIKVELLKLLKAYKADLGDKYNNIAGKIGELHKIKRTSVEYKFYKLLEYAKIDVTVDIQYVLDELRHKSVHEGEIGEGEAAYKNYTILDNLLRDIILNLIGYDQIRNRMRY